MDAGGSSQLAAEEIRGKYADVLRAGKMRMNGELVCWDTDNSTELQLASFSDAFMSKLRSFPSFADAADIALRHTSHLFCKAVSLNYVLIEVLELLKSRTGVICSIDPRPAGKTLVEYSVDVLPNSVLEVCIAFGGRDNIVWLDPETCDKQVKGTITSLKAKFKFPPKPGFAPVYTVDMSLESSWSRLRSMGRKVLPKEVIFVREGLIPEPAPSPPEASVDLPTIMRASSTQRCSRRKLSAFTEEQSRSASMTKAITNPEEQLKPEMRRPSVVQHVATKMVNAALGGIVFPGSACAQVTRLSMPARSWNTADRDREDFASARSRTRLSSSGRWPAAPTMVRTWSRPRRTCRTRSAMDLA